MQIVMISLILNTSTNPQVLLTITVNQLTQTVCPIFCLFQCARDAHCLDERGCVYAACTSQGGQYNTTPYIYYAQVKTTLLCLSDTIWSCNFL